MSQDQATVAEEEYLQIIYWLQEAGLPITGANIARAMQVSAPDRPRDDRPPRGGRVRDPRRGQALSFTEQRREHAAQIVRRHRLIERFLTDVFDIPWDQVHEEAEQLEHWMSPMVEERMLRAIGDAKTCPHGHPIFEGEREQGVPLADVEEGATVRVLRFENEAEDLLHYLKDTGLHPGLEGKLGQSGEDEIVIESDGATHAITRSVAETVSVVADPSPPVRGAARPAGPGQRALRALASGRAGTRTRPLDRRGSTRERPGRAAVPEGAARRPAWTTPGPPRWPASLRRRRRRWRAAPGRGRTCG